MLRRRAEPAGDQQRAELVAVQRDSVRFIVQSRPPYVGSRGMLQQLLFDRGAEQRGGQLREPR
jgi:hypothetical protein